MINPKQGHVRSPATYTAATWSQTKRGEKRSATWGRTLTTSCVPTSNARPANCNDSNWSAMEADTSVGQTMCLVLHTLKRTCADSQMTPAPTPRRNERTRGSKKGDGSSTATATACRERGVPLAMKANAIYAIVHAALTRSFFATRQTLRRAGVGRWRFGSARLLRRTVPVWNCLPSRVAFIVLVLQVLLQFWYRSPSSRTAGLVNRVGALRMPLLAYTQV